MDEKLLAALLGFAGGFFTGLLKLIMPSYRDLMEENRDLREKVRSLSDTLDDERSSD